jgi:hypothetical protein
VKECGAVASGCNDSGRLGQAERERLPLRFRQVGGFVTLGVVVMAVAAVLGAWLVTSGVENNRTAPLITGVFLIALSVPMVFMLCSLYLRPLVVTEEHVLIPGVVSRKHVAMSELARCWAPLSVDTRNSQLGGLVARVMGPVWTAHRGSTIHRPARRPGVRTEDPCDKAWKESFSSPT